MSWYHQIASFLNSALPELRATRRTNLALLTVAILERPALAISVLVRAWRLELPYSHHQRKKRLFRFLSNTGFDTIAVQTALLGPICQGAKLQGVTPIMIDWSDLGQGRNGLFAAVCFRGRGAAPVQLGGHAGRVGPVPEPSGGVLHRSAVTSFALQHPTPGFGRPGLWLSQPDQFRAADAPPHRLPCGLRDPPQGRPRIKYGAGCGGAERRLSRPTAGLSPAQRPDLVLAAHPLPLRWHRGHQSGAVLGRRASEPPYQVRGRLWYLATSLSDHRQAVRMYRKRMQPEQYFKSLTRAATRGRQATLRVEPEHRDHHPPPATIAGRTAAGLRFVDTGRTTGIASFPTTGLLPGQAGHPQPGLRILPRRP